MKQKQRCFTIVHAHCGREQLIKHTKMWLRDGYRLIALDREDKAQPFDKQAFKVTDLMKCVERGVRVYLSHTEKESSIGIHSLQTVEHPGLAYQYTVRTSTNKSAAAPVRFKKTTGINYS